MPQQSRAQRRRQPVRSAQSAARQQQSEVRQQQSVVRQQQPRRAVRAVEPVDYSKDYAAVRHDLRRIALWSVLLFVGMVALYFVL
jgi:hypothetical protein